jgi:hypothetical protein
VEKHIDKDNITEDETLLTPFSELYVKGAYNALRIHLETNYLAVWSKANKDTPIMQLLNKRTNQSLC